MPGTNLSKLVLCASVIAGTLSSPSRVDAATLSLSEGPLFLGTSVEPNILMLIDDSGSMDWMLVAPGSGTDGIMDGPPQSNTQAIDGTWPMFECIANAVPFAGLNSSGDCNADNDAGRLVRNGSSGTPPDRAFVQVDYGYTHATSDNNDDGLSTFTQTNGLHLIFGTGAVPLDEIFIYDAANPNWRTPPNNNTGTSGNPAAPASAPSPGCPAVNPTRTGYWRAANPDFNGLYYNPEVRYAPWAGSDSGGTAFGNATASAARLNAYDSSVGTYNLTTYQDYKIQVQYGATDNDGNGTIGNAEKCVFTDGTTRGGVERFLTLANGVNTAPTGQNARYKAPRYFPAHFYKWDDTHKMNSDGKTCSTTVVTGNGVVDPDDCHYYYEIRSSPGTPIFCPQDVANPATCAPTTFAKTGTGRTDCASLTSCTAAEEQQNFANWFQVPTAVAC